MATSKKRFILNKRKIMLRTTAIILIISSIVIFFTSLNATPTATLNTPITQTSPA